MRHRAINDLDSGLNRQIILAMACYAVTASRCALLRPTRLLEIVLPNEPNENEQESPKRVTVEPNRETPCLSLIVSRWFGW
jgi:hypothetical protein